MEKERKHTIILLTKPNRLLAQSSKEKTTKFITKIYLRLNRYSIKMIIDRGRGKDHGLNSTLSYLQTPL